MSNSSTPLQQMLIQSRYLITFLVDEHGQEVDLQKQGIGLENAVDLRNRLKCFAVDWERPEMDAYDNL